MTGNGDISEADLAAVREWNRVPSKSELATLVERYFVGPIEPGVVDRLDQQFRELLADPEKRSVTAHQFRGNGRRYFGYAWKELLSPHNNLPSATELAVWLAVVTPGYPPVRLYCPEPLVGEWLQREPSPARWRFAADGSFETDDKHAKSRSHWCVHRVESASSLVGDEIWCWRGRRPSSEQILAIKSLSSSAMRIRYTTMNGVVHCVLERA